MVAAVTRVAFRWLIGSLAALIAAWALVPAAVPIYDGPGQPDEPYRYVQPPAGAKATKPPTVAQATLTVNAAGLSGAGYANSLESGPQIVLYVPGGALKAPPGASKITLTETPIAPSPPLPKDGTIVTNVYRITATSPSGPVQVVGRGDVGAPSLQMRAPSGKQPGPVFEHRSGDIWQQQPTIRVGADIYQASAPAFGDWALVQLTDSPTTASSSGINVGLLAGGIAVLLIAGIIIGVRVVRTRRI